MTGMNRLSFPKGIGLVKTAVRGPLCLMAWLVLALVLLANQAQEAKPALLFSADPKEATNPIVDILLRPNAEQQIFCYVKNPTEEARKFTVVVKTVEGAELAKGEVAVAAKKTMPVKLAKPMPPPQVKKPAEEKKPAEAADKKTPEEKKVELPELKGPAFRLQFQLLDEKGKAVEERVSQIAVMTPPQYLDANAAYNADTKRLVVPVKTQNTFSGPPSTVELVVRPEFLPGLIPASTKDGVYRQKLTRPGQEVKLVANNLRFEEGAPRSGLIFLDADGIERAFKFQADFSSSSGTVPFTQVRDPALRVAGGIPEPNKDAIRLYTRPVPRFGFRLEVDNPPEGSRVEVALDRDKDGEFDETEILKMPTSQLRKVFINPEGPDGGFLFKTEVRDWIADVDTAEVLGDHPFRVQLLSADGKEIRQVDGTLVVDSTPPEKIKFGELPKKVVKGKGLPVTATATDPESGISQAVFFLGALKDGKPPMEVVLVKGRRLADEPTVWAADLPLPPDKKGPVEITVQFTNGAGLTATETQKVELTDAVPVGHIKGKVVEGDRPQAGVDVVLKNDKAEVKGTTKTNDKGEFSFENVMPGAYKVSSAKKASKTKGEEAVTVEVDKTKEVTIKLLR
jgi:hypothetical protein